MPEPSHVSFPTYLDHIRSDSARFREVLTDCDPSARVPGCPDWDAADLLWHLAEVQWFWAKTIRTRPAPPDQVDVPPPSRPESYDELLKRFDDFSQSLVAELGQADPDEPAWHWAPTKTVGTSYRRQAHEALIHRLDAEQTAGAVTALDPALAADGVLEVLDVMYGGEPPEWGRFEPGGQHVRLDLTDVGQTIWVQPGMFYGTEPDSGKNYDGPHILVVDDPEREPDAVIRGAAPDIDAWLWKRRDDSGIDITGDRATYDAFWAAVSAPLD